MDEQFEKWWKDNEMKFAYGHYDEKEIAYTAWIESRDETLISLCEHQNNINDNDTFDFDAMLAEMFG